MAPPLLAAALIVRDEATNLPGCLAALRALGPLVDHVVVHDTGSVDESREIARDAGATVIEGSWQGDFGRARNVALDATRARWVLMVDADERVVADRDRLEALLRGAGEASGVVVPLVTLGPGAVEQYTAPIVRILRPDRARFAGRLHERAESLDPRVPLHLVEAPREVLTLRHLGYADPAAVRRKAQRNLELADAEVAAAVGVAAADGDVQQRAILVRALYHRGRTLLSAGRVREALTDLEHLRAVPVPISERLWGLDVLAQLLLTVGRTEAVEDLVREMSDLGADAQYCAWLRGSAAVAEGRFADALRQLRRVNRLVDTVGRELDPTPAVEAHLIAAGREGAVDEATACCIRLMAGLGRAQGLGPLLLTLWGDRPTEPLALLLAEADHGHLAEVADELRTCAAPGPAVAAALPTPPGDHSIGRDHAVGHDHASPTA